MLRLLALAAALAASAAAAAREVLTFHNFLGPNAFPHTELILPWAEQIKEASGGELVIELYPSMSLGGAPPDLYSQLRDGTVDMAWPLLGYTPGLFPHSEVFELPSVHGGSAHATNLAIRDLYEEYLAEEFSEVVVLLIHVHPGNSLQLAEEGPRRFADLAGLKLRTPSRSGGWLIEEWGGDPVGMPLPEISQALVNGSIEGAFLPFEILPPSGIYQHVGSALERERGYGTSVFLIGMNRDRYDSLPPHLRRIIDESKDYEIFRDVGVAWDLNEVEAERFVVREGVEIHPIDPADAASFSAADERVERRWIEHAREAGIEDPERLLADAKAAVARHSGR